MEFRIDPNVTSARSTATIEDIYRLHDAAPDPDATGDGVTVAVMDSGVDTNHPVFDGVTVRQHDFTGNGEGDEVGHGTATAGLVARLAPDAEIVSLRIFGDSGRTGMKPISEAYDWLISHADEVDICNFSWGASQNVPPLNAVHESAIRAGVQDVVAAGNTGDHGGSPATAPNAFSVGALTVDGEVTRFSSYDPNRDNPDVSALGKDLRLPRADGTSMGHVIDDEWVKASGTSFSAPITAGLAARYRSSRDGDVPTRFESTARDIKGTPEDGAGIVDYGAAMEQPKSPASPKTRALVYGLGDVDFVLLDDDVLKSGPYEVVEVEDDTLQFTASE